MNKEYFYLGLFAAVFAIILGVTVDAYEMTRDNDADKSAADYTPQPNTNFPYTAVAFLVGAGTSILAGYIGMRIAVYSNTRTTFMCCSGEKITVGDKVYKDLAPGFMAAFRGGQVLGFVLVGLALLILEVIIATFRASWFDATIESGALKANLKGTDDE